MQVFKLLQNGYNKEQAITIDIKLMKIDLPLPQDKKLTVIFRVEPGCLGPEGPSHVNGFCEYAIKQLEDIDSDMVHWDIMPRNDKSEPEMQYMMISKNLVRDKAEKFLQLFDKNIDDFENTFHDNLAQLIDEYLGH